MANELQPQRQFRSPFVRATGARDGGISRGLDNLAGALGNLNKRGGFFDRKRQELAERADAELAVDSAVSDKEFFEKNQIPGIFHGMARPILEARRGVAQGTQALAELHADPTIDSMGALEQRFGETISAFRDANPSNADAIEAFERELLAGRGKLQEKALKRTIDVQNLEAEASLSAGVQAGMTRFHAGITDGTFTDEDFFDVVLGGMRENAALAQFFLPGGTFGVGEKDIVDGIKAFAELNPEDASELLEVAAKHGRFDSDSTLELAKAATTARSRAEKDELARLRRRDERKEDQLVHTVKDFFDRALEDPGITRDPTALREFAEQVGDPIKANSYVRSIEARAEATLGLASDQENQLADLLGAGRLVEYRGLAARLRPTMTADQRIRWDARDEEVLGDIHQKVRRNDSVLDALKDPFEVNPEEIVEAKAFESALRRQAVLALSTDPEFNVDAFFQQEVTRFKNNKTGFTEPVSAPSFEEILRRDRERRQRSSKARLEELTGIEAGLIAPSEIYDYLP